MVVTDIEPKLMKINNFGILSISFPITNVFMAAMSPPENENKAPIELLTCMYCSKKEYNEGRVDEKPMPNIIEAYVMN